MNGIKTIASCAFGTLRRTERTSFRILRTGWAPSNSFILSDQGLNLSMVSGIHTSKRHSNSQFNGSGFGKTTSRGYMSALALGLLGVGGVTLLWDMKKENVFNSLALFGAVYCKPNDDECACKENKCADSDCLRKGEKEEEIIQKANAELEKALKDTKSKAVEFTEAALKAYCDAIEAIKLFMNKVYCAVEEENLDSPRFEEVWCDVYDALKKRCDLAKDAMEKGQCAWELLRRLREVIENGKACKYTSCNPLLKTAEETLECAEKELCAKKAAMDAILKESRVVEQYRNLIEEFRRDLKAEAESIVPSEECRVTLNDNEANMVLTHAYKKILRAQKELNKGGKNSGTC